jgi:alpha-mannosidase II
MKQQFKILLKNKQIEFILGGWVMNDDVRNSKYNKGKACPTYSSIIDQISLGNEWLHKEFGAIPTIGWQIDPFG